MKKSKSKDEDHYIKSLKFAQEQEEFTFSQLSEAIALTELQKKQLAMQIHYGEIFLQNASDFINNYETTKISLAFSVKDKFRLLEYQALQEARADANSSTRWATTAFVASIISLLTSVAISYIQLSSPITLPEKFIKTIESMAKQQKTDSDLIQRIENSLKTGTKHQEDGRQSH